MSDQLPRGPLPPPTSTIPVPIALLDGMRDLFAISISMEGMHVRHEAAPSGVLVGWQRRIDRVLNTFGMAHFRGATPEAEQAPEPGVEQRISRGPLTLWRVTPKAKRGPRPKGQRRPQQEPQSPRPSQP